MFICYNYDANAILCEPIKSRSGENIASAWNKCHSRLTKNGHKTNLYILDNEISSNVKDAMETHEVDYQKVPPGIHRRNAAEKAIQTFKNHLLAGLASCDPNFPIREWDRLLEQCELTINLLRNSRVNPNLSSWAYLFGNHDFNRVPLCPPGTKALLHLKPNKRPSWSFHAEDGFYIGPAWKHYRCVRVFIPKTHAERTTDTLTLMEAKIPIPLSSIDDHIKSTTEQLIHLLLNKKKPIGLFLESNTKQDLLKLTDILHRDLSEKIKLNELPQNTTKKSTSEGELSTSEGALSTSKGDSSLKELNFDALIKENITAQENKNFDKTIRQFKYNLRKNPPTYEVHKKSKPLVLPPPKIHPISTPVPKSMPLFRKHNINL